MSDDNIEDILVNEQSQQNTQEGDSLEKKSSEILYSTRLKEKYNESSVSIIKNQIIITLGSIQALNQINLIEEIANSTSSSNGLRASAMTALSKFEHVDKDLYERINELYEKLRKSDTPTIRISAIEALETSYINTKNTQYLEWIQEGLKDNDIQVRIQTLKSLYNIYNKNMGGKRQDEVYLALKYMVNYDPEILVKKEAIKTIAIFKTGNNFLIEKITHIKYLDPMTKAYINIAVNDIADKGGIHALVDLIKRNIDAKTTSSSLVEYIASAMSRSDSGDFTPLIKILIKYDNSSVVSDCITTITRNKLSSMSKELVAIAGDYTQSTSVRNKARKALETLTVFQTPAIGQ